MNDYRDYLKHHGIRGQKWGKKNGPPYPLGSDISTGSSLKRKKKAGKYTMQLNKLDQQRAKDARRAQEADDKYEQYQRKIDKQMSKRMTNRRKNKINKLQSKQSMQRQIRTRYKVNVANGKKQIQRILDKANGKGYTIDSKEIMRDVTYGKEWVLYTLLSSVTPGVSVIPERKIRGTLYKVQDSR